MIALECFKNGGKKALRTSCLCLCAMLWFLPTAGGELVMGGREKSDTSEASGKVKEGGERRSTRGTRWECDQGKEIVAAEEGGGGTQEEGRLNVLIHGNTASNQCTALRLAEQLRAVRQQYIHVPTEGQREGG